MKPRGGPSDAMAQSDGTATIHSAETTDRVMAHLVINRDNWISWYLQRGRPFANEDARDPCGPCASSRNTKNESNNHSSRYRKPVQPDLKAVSEFSTRQLSPKPTSTFSSSPRTKHNNDNRIQTTNGFPNTSPSPDDVEKRHVLGSSTSSIDCRVKLTAWLIHKKKQWKITPPPPSWPLRFARASHGPPPVWVTTKAPSHKVINKTSWSGFFLVLPGFYWVFLG